ncbi:MAG: MIP/aquaporin family protein [Hyphomicrobiales bacterium]|nr:MIP/aquaporin family protein [Hyphomicrobiales bacterium]
MALAGIERRLIAEALGSCLLAAVVIGSGIMGERLASGNVGVALLANAIATGAGLVVLILTFGPVSGAHFNPAVSLAFCLRGELPMREGAYYATAQIGGALAGAVLAHAMFDMSLVQTGTQIRTGAGQWIGEAMATAMLLMVIFACLRSAPAAIPYAVGLVITANYWATSSTSFANPAITIARTITDTFAAIRPEDAPAFIAAQLAAAVATVYLARWLYAETPQAK